VSGAPSAAGIGDSAASLNLPMRLLLATTMIGTAYAGVTRRPVNARIGPGAARALTRPNDRSHTPKRTSGRPEA
jgi:hypothetical protein